MNRMNVMLRLAGAAVLVTGASAAAAAAPPERLPEGAMAQLFASAAGVDDAVVQKLEIELAGDDLGTTARIPILIDGRLEVMNLQPYDARAVDCRLMVQTDEGMEERALPPSVQYRGVLESDADRQVAASIHDGRLRAMVLDPDGTSWGVQPTDALVPEMGGMLDGWSVVYRNDSIVPGDWTCGTTEASRPMPQVALENEHDGAPSPLGVPGRTQIAFDADYEYYQLNGSSVINVLVDIETVMNQVGLIYQNQLGICYRFSGYIVRATSSDPYTSSDPDTLLCQFRATWNAAEYYSRDIAHLFTGRNLDGTTIGIAWLGVVCQGVFSACGGVVDDTGYGLSQSQFTTNFTNRVQLTAHELGHNWNACHCNQSGCTGGAPDSDCGIMNSSVDGSTAFGSRSLTSISLHKATRTCLGTCYNPTYVDVAHVGFEFGTFTFPFNTALEGYWAATVNGVVSFDPGVYQQNIIMAKPLVLERTVGGTTVVIGD